MTKIDQTYQRIASYLSGNMPSEEQSAFNKWLAQASAEEKELFVATQKLWIKSADEHAKHFEPNVDRALKRVQVKRQFREQPKQGYWRYAAVVAVLLSAIISIWLLNNSTPDQFYRIAQNSVEQLALPDGSTIWLSPGTSVSYNEDFINQREIQLSGKAFFEVAKRSGQPFTVFTANTKTQVLGTSFNLESGDDGQVAIQVTTGKVAFSDLKSTEPVFLTPGKQARYLPKREKIVTNDLPNENYRAWQTKVLTFDNTSISVLFNTLADYYQTNFEVDEQLNKCRFTTSFENQQLEEVLDILELTGNLTIKQTSSGYAVSGNTCD
ncbi:FecR family protein [Marinoscillum sp.]|uniref:FecR family protein n=1 Tax=Marinoscillum sp. TaxID=2024838 RepID=UPI003BA8EAA8